MLRKLLAVMIALCLHVEASAQAPLPLDDAELAQVTGGDGVGIAVHLVLNDPSIPGMTPNRRTWGFKDGNGDSTYLVFQNMHGKIDMFALGIDIEKKPDGGDYVALTLPTHLRFTDFGVDSISAQIDPAAPVSGSIGSFNIDGNLSMQGQMRFWAH
ncbi:hypothetical protein GCM10027343_31470 [Noviherbaspirillum agri]